jgi:UDP-N-acetylglucosamine transferase subunit ALG13
VIALVEPDVDQDRALAPRVVVFLGTDHHPFTRLVEWVDRWAGAHRDIPCFIQHGPAPPPRHASGSAYVGVDELRSTVATADVIVGHAGPGTIIDALEAGRVPVVLPRLARFGEVVDDHQVAFGRLMHQRGRAVCVEDEHALGRAIEEALSNPGAVAPPSPHEARATITLVGDLIDGLLAR